MLSAAAVTDPTTSDILISKIHNYAASNQNGSQFLVIFNPSSGEPVDIAAGVNSPAIGSVFSFLAMK